MHGAEVPIIVSGRTFPLNSDAQASPNFWTVPQKPLPLVRHGWLLTEPALSTSSAPTRPVAVDLDGVPPFLPSVGFWVGGGFSALLLGLLAVTLKPSF